MVWCWWCCHPFEGPELHMPFKYDDLRKRFMTMGCFCSWPCMKAYNIDRGGPKYGEYQMFITLMRKHVYNKIEPCRVAPKRQCLKVFGGTLDIDEFRLCTDPPMIHMPNEIHMLCNPSIETTLVPTTTHSSSGKMDAVMNSSGKSDQLKLKRAKPLQRVESSLEKSLGIKRISKT